MRVLNPNIYTAICGNKMPTRCNRLNFIADLIACSTRFEHHYAHHQELESILFPRIIDNAWSKPHQIYTATTMPDDPLPPADEFIFTEDKKSCSPALNKSIFQKTARRKMHGTSSPPHRDINITSAEETRANNHFDNQRIIPCNFNL
jgi:hypothetical protein